MKNLYESVEEIDISDIPIIGYRSPDPMVISMWNELKLRFERTAKTKALTYLFKDKKSADKTRNSVMRQAVKEYGTDALRSQLYAVDDKGGYRIAFYRSTNWPK